MASLNAATARSTGDDLVGRGPAGRTGVGPEAHRRALDPLDQVDLARRGRRAAPSVRDVLKHEPPMPGHDPLAGQLAALGRRPVAPGPARHGRRQAQREPQRHRQPRPDAHRLDPSHLPHAAILLSSASFAAAHAAPRRRSGSRRPPFRSVQARRWSGCATGWWFAGRGQDMRCTTPAGRPIRLVAGAGLGRDDSRIRRSAQGERGRLMACRIAGRIEAGRGAGRTPHPGGNADRCSESTLRRPSSTCPHGPSPSAPSARSRSSSATLSEYHMDQRFARSLTWRK